MSRHIQAEISETTHRRLQALARQQDASLKDVIKQAVEEYVRAHASVEEDPIWQLVGSGDLPPGNWSERKNWRFPELD